MADPRPLDGRRVLVTRAPAAAVTWVEELRARGASVRAREVFTLESLVGSAPVDRCLERIAQWDWILLTSQNGLRYLGEGLAARGLLLRDLSARIGVVGPSTAKALEKQGRSPDAVAVPPDGLGLAATLEERVRRGQRILIVRPEQAREGLAERLEALGAEVHAIPFYRNRPAKDVARVVEELVGGAYEAVVFGSPSAFNRLAESSGGRAAEAFTRVALVAIGGTTAEAIRSRGSEVAAVASTPTPEGIADAVEVALSR